MGVIIGEHMRMWRLRSFGIKVHITVFILRFSHYGFLMQHYGTIKVVSWQYYYITTGVTTPSAAATTGAKSVASPLRGSVPEPVTSTNAISEAERGQQILTSDEKHITEEKENSGKNTA